jgi:hypothetical protein
MLQKICYGNQIFLTLVEVGTGRWTSGKNVEISIPLVSE